MVMRNINVGKRNILSKLLIKNFSYFYQFNNLKSKVPSSSSNKDMLNPQIVPGIEFGYRNFIEAVYDKDFDYLSQICEENFAQSLEKSIEDNKHDLYISSPEDIDVRVMDLKFDLHLPLTVDRNKNNQYEFTKSEENNGFMNINGTQIPKFLNLGNIFNFYTVNMNKVKMDGLQPSFVLRITADIKTNLILSNSEIKKESSETHNILFEIEYNKIDSIVEALNVPNMLLTYFKFMKPNQFNNNSDSNPDKKAIISDFDNFMKGNPLVKI